MRRLLFVVLLAGLAMGPVCGMPIPGEDPSRLEVTDTLRATCAEYGLTDSAIATLITWTEEQRLAGMTRMESLEDGRIGCLDAMDRWGPECGGPCLTCATAITQQVYGH